MFEGFTPFDIPIEPSLTIHGVKSGSDRGPPLLLLHGFPQTHHIWHLVAPKLVSQYTVIALDLRGYGQSSKPKGSKTHEEYAKSNMAADCVKAMKHLGYESFYLCSHDRGARVAHKLCVDYPDTVKKVMFIDICPTATMYKQTDQFFATAYWHWFFLIQPAPFPEDLIAGNAKVFAEKLLGAGLAMDRFGEEALGEYVRCLGDWESVHGMCEDYRAAATVDLEEAKRDEEEGRKVVCPIRVLWGKKGVVEMRFDALEEWKRVSVGGVDGEALDAGHYIPEESPDEVVRHIKEFFA